MRVVLFVLKLGLKILAAPCLPLFSLPVSLHFCGPQAIMESETEVKADVDI